MHFARQLNLRPFFFNTSENDLVGMNHQKNKQFIGKFRAALYDCDAAVLKDQLRELFAPDCEIHLAFPFEDLDGPDGLFEAAYRPLLTAVPDLERRDFIVMAGESNGHNWVGCGGHYMGVMQRPFLDIPPTQHAIFMRYAEFFRIEANKIVEMQALWDIPQLMMQANAWPLTPSLGVEWFVPAPRRRMASSPPPMTKPKQMPA